MAAELHALDQRRLIDSNGIAASSTIGFYLTGSTTPATIYSDAALATPLTNPFVVNAGAAVPDIYLDSAVTYRRIITYADGSTDDTDPYTTPFVGAVPLAATGGAALVGTIQTGTGAVARTAQAKLREIVSNTDYTGGFDDAITAVRNNDDAAFSGAIVLPNGINDISAAVTPPQSFARVTGYGGQTIRALTAIDIFDLSGASHSNSQFSNFRTYGGVNVFDASTVGEIASNEYHNLDISLFSGDAFYFSAGVTSCLFDNLKIDSTTGDRGLYSNGGINNDNTLNHIHFTNLTDSAIKFAGTCNGLYISNSRVEGGGVSAKAVYDLTAVSGVRIGTGWYEGHHEYLLRLNGTSTGVVTIDGIVDIGAKDGAGFKASLFDVGSNLVVFGTNEWDNRTTAPLNCLVYGYNEDLDCRASNLWDYKTNRGGRVHLKKRDVSVDGSTFDLLTITRSVATPNDFSNLQSLSGVLTIAFVGPDGGAVVRSITRTFPVFLASAGSAFDLTVGSATFIVENAGAITLTPQPKAGGTSTSKTIELVLAGVNAGFNSLIDVTFEYTINGTLAANQLAVTAA